VFDSVDCISDLYAQLAREHPPGFSKVIAAVEAKRLAAYEPAVLMRTNGVVVSSLRDKHGLNLLAAEKKRSLPPIQVISNGVDCDYFSPGAENIDRYSIVFIGKIGYSANSLAAKHFINEILPMVRAEQPNAKFTIVGANPPSDLRTLKQHGVAVTGWVPDIRPYLSAAHVVVCPLKVSVGIQNKLLEAMAAAKGIVTYPGPARTVSNDGLPLFLEADSPEAFAKHVIKLFQSDALRTQLGTNARAYVRARFNWENQTDRLERFYRDVLTDNHHQRIHAS
jgi:glycosyltransferase involved in cell wall biosynthesis